jgi:hypothetical protein
MEIDDVWKYEISSYLDYETRNNLNRVLPFEARLTKKIPLNLLKSHAAKACYPMVEKHLYACRDFLNESQCQEANARQVIILFEKFLEPTILPIFYLKKLRDGTLDKCKQFYNFTFIPEDLKDALNTIIDKLRNEISKFDQDEDINSLKVLEF